MSRIGDMYHEVSIQVPYYTKLNSGQETETWNEWMKVRAEKLTRSGTDKDEYDQEVATNEVMYRIWWLEGLQENHRIVEGDDIYDILHIGEEERRKFMLVKCVKKDNV